MRTTKTADANGTAGTDPAPATVGFLAGQLAARCKEEAVAFYRGSSWRTWAWIAAGLLLAYFVAGRLFAKSESLPPTIFGATPAFAPAFPTPAVYSPAPPAALPSSLTFVCRSAANVRGKLLLNDTVNFREAAVTVVCQGPEFANVSPAAFTGHTVTVTGGTPSSYKGRPELLVSSAGQLQVR